MTDGLSEEGQGTVSKVQRVRHAANTLGISERTVYRRLRSGKIEALPTVNEISVNVMTDNTEVHIEEAFRSQMRDLMDQLRCQNDMTVDKMSDLCQTLTQRDAQIRTLLESQQELTRTIQNLQGQIYELARLALTQTVREQEQAIALPSEGEQVHVQSAAEGRNWLRSLWKRFGSR